MTKDTAVLFYQGLPHSTHKTTDWERGDLENEILLTLDIHAFGLDNII